MRRLSTAIIALLLSSVLIAACTDNDKTGGADGGTKADAGEKLPDGGVALAPCLDRPTDLSRPPTGQLPCELLPPGFAAR